MERTIKIEKEETYEEMTARQKAERKALKEGQREYEVWKKEQEQYQELQKVFGKNEANSP